VERRRNPPFFAGSVYATAAPIIDGDCLRSAASAPASKLIRFHPAANGLPVPAHPSV